MSFLSRLQPIARQSAITKQAPRLFTTTAIQRKGPIEAGKDVLKSVDRTISDAAVKGIDKGIEAKDAVASTAGVETSKAAGSAQETAGQAQGKAAQVGGEAQGKAAELAGKAKGAAEEVKGKMS